MKPQSDQRVKTQRSTESALLSAQNTANIAHRRRIFSYEMATKVAKQIYATKTMTMLPFSEEIKTRDELIIRKLLDNNQ